MKLVERFRRMLEGVPPGAALTLPVDVLREWLDAPEREFEPDLTVKEVAELFGRSPGTIRSWIRSGDLDAYVFRGREYRVTQAALMKFRDDGIGE